MFHRPQKTVIQLQIWLEVLYIDLRPGRAVKIGNAPM